MSYTQTKQFLDIRYGAWAAYFSGITAILGLVFLILFFGLESSPNSTQTSHFWGPIRDIASIFQMLSLLIVALAFYLMLRLNAHLLKPANVSLHI